MTQFIPGTSQPPLTNGGYGLLLAPYILGACSPARCSELAGVIDSVAQADPAMDHIRTHLRDVERGVRMAGLRAISMLFAERPDIRPLLERAVAGNISLALTLHPSRNARWMRSADAAMGFGEVVAPDNDAYFERVLAGLPGWCTDPARQEPLASEGFRLSLLSLFEKMRTALDRDDTIEDEEKWHSALKMLFIYYAAHRARPLPNQDIFVDRIHVAIIISRALERLRRLGTDSKVADAFEKEFGLALLQGDLKLDPRKKTAFFLDLWKRICAATPPSNPLLRTEPERIGGCYKLFFEWLDVFVRGIRSTTLPREGTDGVFARHADRLRAVAIERRDYSVLRRILLDFNSVSEARGKFLEVFADLERAGQPTVMDPPSAVAEKRRVIWNPSASAENLFLHPKLGEVYLISQPDAGGLVSVNVPRRQEVVRVMSSTLVSARDTDAFEKAMRERVAAYRRIAEPFAALAIMHYMSQDDPALALLRECMFKKSRSPSSALQRWCWFIGNMRHHGIAEEDLRAMSGAMQEASKLFGFDAVAWGWLLSNGAAPDELLIRGGDKRTSPTMLVVRNQITSDLVRGMYQYRPWQVSWRGPDAPAVSNLRVAGFYYPAYYTGERPNDLTQLTYDFAGGRPGSAEEVADKIRPLVDDWVGRMRGDGKDVILVPMIGRAPNNALAEILGYPNVFPWMARPSNYGQGVEGLTLYQKMEVLAQALRLDPQETDGLRRKAVLIIDDNVTDRATYMLARRLFYDAGVEAVGIVALSETIRRPDEILLEVR